MHVPRVEWAAVYVRSMGPLSVFSKTVFNYLKLNLCSLSYLNLHPIEVVSRYRDSHLKWEKIADIY